MNSLNLGGLAASESAGPSNPSPLPPVGFASWTFLLSMETSREQVLGLHPTSADQLPRDSSPTLSRNLAYHLAQAKIQAD